MWVGHGPMTPKPRFLSAGISFVYNTAFTRSTVFSILAIDVDVCRIHCIGLITPAITEFYDRTAMTTLLPPV